MIYRLLKNETIKMIHSKKNFVLIGCLLFLILSIVYIMFTNQRNILNDMPQIRNLNEQLKNDILNMNSVIFLRQFSTEFIFRPVVPYFIFFMVITSVEMFGEDFFSGNMKFFINIDKERSNVFISKVLALFVYSIFIVALNIILGFIIGCLFFDISFNGLSRIIIIYLSSIIPVVSFSLVIGLVSLYVENKKLSIVIGIASSIFITVADRLTATSTFSPIGILGLMDKVKPMNIQLSELIFPNMVSLIYLFVFFMAGIYIFKNKEFKY